MNKKPYICISPDIDVLYQDSEGCCTSAYGDMISEERPSLGPRFSIVVPGIEEWVKRYEMATDFAETETDPAFDWATWHYEGFLKSATKPFNLLLACTCPLVTEFADN